jgi:DNA-binding NarL/FixJ family response regulator
MKYSDEIISVWIIDDDETICASLKEFIHQNAPYIEVLAFVGCERAYEMLRKGQTMPDVILLDIHMPEISGIDGLPELKKLSPGSAIIMLTASFMDEEILQAFSRGADGYILKTVQINQIIDSIKAAMRGGVPMDPLVARKILAMNAGKGSGVLEPRLTELEKDIVRLLVEGSTLRQICQKMSMNYPGFNAYLTNIQSKLDVRTRSALVMKAQREKLV